MAEKRYGKGKIAQWMKDNPEKLKEAQKLGRANKTIADNRRKALKELLELALTIKDSEGVQNDEKMTMAIIEKAIRGDVKAFHEIRDSLGECVDKVELSTNDTVKISITGDEDN